MKTFRPGGSRARFVFVVAQFVGSAGNFAAHLLITRALTPEGYGVLGAFLVLLSVLAVPTATCGTLVSAAVARMLARGSAPDTVPAMRRAAVLSLVPACANLVAIPVWIGYLHLDSATPVILLSGYIVLLGAGLVPWGVLCGSERFAAAGLVTCGATATRIVFVLAAGALGWGVTGVLTATVAAEGLRVLVCRLLVGRRGDTLISFEVTNVARGVSALMGVWLLASVGTVVARHTMPDGAGQFALHVTLAQTVFFIAQMFATLAVPRFAVAAAGYSLLALSFGVLGALGLLAAAGLAAAAPLLELAFGGAYDIDPVLAALLVAAASIAGALWMINEYHLARGGIRRALPPWLGVGVLLAATSFWTLSAIQLAMVLVLASAVALGAAVASRTTTRPPAVPRPAKEPVPLPHGMIDVTVVVPFYNPGDALRPNLLSLVEALRSAGVSFEIIAVEDGCTDGSPATIADLDPLLVRHLALPVNSGKGAALRLGLREGRGRYVGFIDADGDLDPMLWQPFLGLVRLYGPDVIVGSKRHPLSEVATEVTMARRACSRGYQLLIRLLFPRLPITDTQVGIKLFRRELLAEVLPLTVERRFVFDLELLMVAWKRGYRRILPAPVTLRRTGGSTITAATVWRMFADTVALAWRLHGTSAYDLPAREAVQEPALALAGSERS